VPQYISDKYVRKLFANNLQDPNISKGVQSSYPNISTNIDSNGPSVKDLLKELRNLGFNDTKVCLEAIRKNGNDIDKIIEYLISMEDDKGTKEQASLNKSIKNETYQERHLDEQTGSDNFPTASTYMIPPEDDYNPWSSIPEELPRENSINVESHDPFDRRKIRNKQTN
jgi:hypothetical protein